MKQATEYRFVKIKRKKEFNSVNGSRNMEERNCISQYNTLTDKERINVINNPCKSKKGFAELRRESCVSFDVYYCGFRTETRCVIFVSPAVNYCHYAFGSTKVTLRSIHVTYRYSVLHTTI